ncbi:MAG TPA: DUF488 domain-containing protein [Desulfuromonadaceae bacterium]|nr:DUF488 domain-containing protein [Desulfuromonadaceae bacterium]
MKTRSIQIWTIGHSTRSFEEFAALLEENAIAALADVRQFPGSRRYPQFGREQLSAALTARHIEYQHFPELGGRRKALADSPNIAWRHEAFRGYADYMMTEPFRGGIKRLAALAVEKRTAIMCAEAVWWKCHRSLISDFLKAHGGHVIHIFAPGKTEPHPYTSAARLVNGKLTYAAAEMETEFHFE